MLIFSQGCIETAMPGGGRFRFVPTKDIPWPAGVVLILTFIQFVVSMVLISTIDRWAKTFLTPGHWYQFRMMGGVAYYLSPGIGWYMDNDLWIYFGGFALFFLIAHFGGVRWKRVR
jgi:hypothetical protein